MSVDKLEDAGLKPLHLRPGDEVHRGDSVFMVESVGSLGDHAKIRFLRNESVEDNEVDVQCSMVPWTEKARVTIELSIHNMELAFAQAVKVLVNQHGWDPEDAKEFYAYHPDELFTAGLRVGPNVGLRIEDFEFTEGLTAEDLAKEPMKKQCVITPRFRVRLMDTPSLSYPYRVYDQFGRVVGRWIRAAKAREQVATDPTFFWVFQNGNVKRGDMVEIDPETQQGIVIDLSETTQRTLTGIGQIDTWLQPPSWQQRYLIFTDAGEYVRYTARETLASAATLLIGFTPGHFILYVSPDDPHPAVGMVVEYDTTLGAHRIVR
jgi:hypothetical protein